MNTRMNGNGSKKTTVDMLREALDKLCDTAHASNVGELNDVRLIVRKAPTVGRHVHASGSVKLRFDACVTEHPAPVRDAEVLE